MLFLSLLLLSSSSSSSRMLPRMMSPITLLLVISIVCTTTTSNNRRGGVNGVLGVCTGFQMLPLLKPTTRGTIVVQQQQQQQQRRRGTSTSAGTRTRTQTTRRSNRSSRTTSSTTKWMVSSSVRDDVQQRQQLSDDDMNHNDLFGIVKQLSESALLLEDDALESLDKLGQLCQQRHSFDFENRYYEEQQKKKDNQKGRNIIQRVPQLIPPNVTDSIYAIVQDMSTDNMLSQNPDSVDGLPSFHLNLISDGTSILDKINKMKSDGNDDSSSSSSSSSNERNNNIFQDRITQLLDLVKPYVYEQLLPLVNDEMDSEKIQVSDVFLRRYNSGNGDGGNGGGRSGLSAHYDVTSVVTAVVALDNVAATGRNGLYTTTSSSTSSSSSTTTISSSNHAALRQFFPLESGDAVLHTWDILHGVDVSDNNLDRTSLIIWFTTTNTSGEDEQETDVTISPWLFGNNDSYNDDDDVAQFVMASAIESNSISSTNSSSAPDSQQQIIETIPQEAIELYLQSAEQENCFALSRIGGIFADAAAAAGAEGDDDDDAYRIISLDDDLLSRAKELLERLRPVSDLATHLFDEEYDDPDSTMGLAKRFWFEASVRGHPLAQISLAQELMVEVTTGDKDPTAHNNSNNKVILAAVLFALSAQQGRDDEHNNVALERLNRVIRYEATSRGVQSEEEFAQLPTIQIANAACSHLSN